MVGLKSEVQSILDVNQRVAACLALGVRGKPTNKAVQSDVGWESFNVRKAQGKI